MSRRVALLAELTDLERQFDALEPELDLHIRDSDCGVEGYVVVWSTLAANGGPLHGCGKGGTRITPTVDHDEVAMLARIMTLKNAAAGLPLGGAKSGLRANPSAANFETTYRRFVSLCKPVLRCNGGLFGGFGFDLGGHPQHAVWACDELGRLDCFTGKALEFGGTDYDREGIAGYGVAVAARTLLEQYGRMLNDTTFAVQGLGAMGAAVFRYMTEFGATPRFVSDFRVGGTWELPVKPSSSLIAGVRSMNIDAVRVALANEAVGPRPADAILGSEVTVLFPCATQDVLTEGNASNVRATFVVEGANNPCSDGARTRLQRHGVTVIPDIIANPGGIIAAYVEMTSTATPEENVARRVNPEKAKRLTREKITDNVVQLIAMARAHEVETQQAARLMALRYIFRSVQRDVLAESMA